MRGFRRRSIQQTTRNPAQDMSRIPLGSALKIVILVWLAIGGRIDSRAQEQEVTLENLWQAGEDWIRENLDESILERLAEVDQERVQKLFHDLQERFEGECVADLAPLKRGIAAILPLLESYEETLPYAVWLRTRLDYFDAAEQYRLTLTPPKPTVGQTEIPWPNPTPEYQRRIWQKELQRKPSPPGARDFVGRLKTIFAGEKVPKELVWLAEVESSFNPQARSPADAVGLYQLRPITARHLGLALEPEDERLLPEKNAGAAAKYLRYLHGKFSDWPLSLAAYNAGETRVRQLLQRHKARSFDRIARHLPAETQQYVPKVEATLWRREGVKLAQLPAPGNVIPPSQ